MRPIHLHLAITNYKDRLCTNFASVNKMSLKEIFSAVDSERTAAVFNFDLKDNVIEQPQKKQKMTENVVDIAELAKKRISAVENVISVDEAANLFLQGDSNFEDSWNDSSVRKRYVKVCKKIHKQASKISSLQIQPPAASRRHN